LSRACSKTVVGKPLKGRMPTHKLKYNSNVGLKKWNGGWICLDHDTNWRWAHDTIVLNLWIAERMEF
jgi:hypothetical protein